MEMTSLTQKMHSIDGMTTYNNKCNCIFPPEHKDMTDL